MENKHATRSSSPLRVSLSSSINSPNKKQPPFHATFRSLDSFGPPTPLPPSPNRSPERHRRTRSEGSEEGKSNGDFQGTNSDLYKNDITESINADQHNISVPDSIAASYLHLLHRQTVRWINLSFALWSLVVLESSRNVNSEGIAQFVDVMSWRAHGTISEDEFSVLFSEWISSKKSGDVVDGANLSSLMFNKPRKLSVGVFLMRQILLEKRCKESDLDLFIGMLILETNHRFLNSSISFSGHHGVPDGSSALLAFERDRDDQAGGSGREGVGMLQVVNSRWLTLTEELFFALDISGYGSLRFDELFFFMACITMGLHSWGNEEELEADLSLAILTAGTLQMMADLGASVTVSCVPFGSFGNNQTSKSHRDHHRLSRSGKQHGRNSGGCSPHSSARSPSASTEKLNNNNNSSSFYQYRDCAVNLSMLKRYLIKHAVTENALAILLAHIKNCVAYTARVTSVEATELYQSSHAIEPQQGAVGAPRLWQQAVLSTSGYSDKLHRQEQQQQVQLLRHHSAVGVGAGIHDNSMSSGAFEGELSIPPVILFLLTDAERLISGKLRGCECPIDGNSGKFIISRSSSISGNGNGSGMGEQIGDEIDATGQQQQQEASTVVKANEELLESTFQVWKAFRSWGKVNDALDNSIDSARSNSSFGQQQQHSFGNVESRFDSELPRDPVYQLILAVVLRYKSLQFLTSAALFDVAAQNFGLEHPSQLSSFHAHFDEENEDARDSRILSITCANIMPNCGDMLLKLGWEEEQPSADAANLEESGYTGYGSEFAPPHFLEEHSRNAGLSGDSPDSEDAYYSGMGVALGATISPISQAMSFADVAPIDQNSSPEAFSAAMAARRERGEGGRRGRGGVEGREEERDGERNYNNYNKNAMGRPFDTPHVSPPPLSSRRTGSRRRGERGDADKNVEAEAPRKLVSAAASVEEMEQAQWRPVESKDIKRRDRVSPAKFSSRGKPPSSSRADNAGEVADEDDNNNGVRIGEGDARKRIAEARKKRETSPNIGRNNRFSMNGATQITENSTDDDERVKTADDGEPENRHAKSEKSRANTLNGSLTTHEALEDRRSRLVADASAEDRLPTSVAATPTAAALTHLTRTRAPDDDNVSSAPSSSSIGDTAAGSASAGASASASASVGASASTILRTVSSRDPFHPYGGENYVAGGGGGSGGGSMNGSETGSTSRSGTPNRSPRPRAQTPKSSLAAARAAVSTAAAAVFGSRDRGDDRALLRSASRDLSVEYNRHAANDNGGERREDGGIVSGSEASLRSRQITSDLSSSTAGGQGMSRRPLSATGAFSHPAGKSNNGTSNGTSNGTATEAPADKLSPLESQLLAELLASTDPSHQARLLDSLKAVRQQQQQHNAESAGNISMLYYGEEDKEGAFSTAAAGSSHNERSPLQYESSSKRSGSRDSTYPPPSPNLSPCDIAGIAATAAGGSARGGGAEYGSDVSSAGAASRGANSIADLLSQGQKAGQYAQTLREILRKMSKDDSSVQLKSLEQVLQLGQQLVDEQQRQKGRQVGNNAVASGGGEGRGSFRTSPAAKATVRVRPLSAHHQHQHLQDQQQQQEQQQQALQPRGGRGNSPARNRRGWDTDHKALPTPTGIARPAPYVSHTGSRDLSREGRDQEGAPTTFHTSTLGGVHTTIIKKARSPPVANGVYTSGAGAGRPAVPVAQRRPVSAQRPSSSSSGGSRGGAGTIGTGANPASMRKIPGQMPDGTTRRKVNMAFGHPVK